MDQDIYPDVSGIRERTGDRFLLCTDGLWKVPPDRQIAKLLADDAEPAAMCANLIAAAKAGGSQDDITCVVVELAPGCRARL
jgi:PPM family protein phosphatase